MKNRLGDKSKKLKLNLFLQSDDAWFKHCTPHEVIVWHISVLAIPILSACSSIKRNEFFINSIKIYLQWKTKIKYRNWNQSEKWSWSDFLYIFWCANEWIWFATKKNEREKISPSIDSAQALQWVRIDCLLTIFHKMMSEIHRLSNQHHHMNLWCVLGAWESIFILKKHTN